MASTQTLLSMLLLLFLFIYTATSQFRPANHNATTTLTPFVTYDNGARVMQSTFDVRTITNSVGDQTWWVTVSSQRGWHFILGLGGDFAFDQTYTSVLSVTMNGPSDSLHTNKLLFGITTDNKQYISMSVPMQDASQPAFVYPQCGNYAAYGDIASLPLMSRKCDIAARDCWNWKPMQAEYTQQLPLTLMFENNPIKETMAIYLTTALDTIALADQCIFPSLPFTNFLKIYMAANEPGHSFMVNSFDISLQNITPAPTKSPTMNPTQAPTSNPSKSPSPAPTPSPTPAPSPSPSPAPTSSPTPAPTSNPTRNPTKAPTRNPTKSPSKHPTMIPTNSPSKSPSKMPTFTPTKTPSNMPSTHPTLMPSRSPTEDPTPQPSPQPTMVPSNFPSIPPTKKPTKIPTTNPTKQPSTDPTGTPSKHPSESPTKDPSPAPTQQPSDNPSRSPTPAPTLNPTLSPSPAPTGQPTPAPTGNPTPAPTDIPTQSPTHSTLNPSVSPSHSPSTRSPTHFPSESPVPAGYQWGAHGNLCPFAASSPYNKCQSNTQSVKDIGGNLLCLNAYDCCMCDSIKCGADGIVPCNSLKLGDYGAYGVKAIVVRGSVNIASNGALIECQGVESCRGTLIKGSNVGTIHCGGDRSCQDAVIIITDPKEDFLLKCAGIGSCVRLRIEIILSGPPAGFRCGVSSNMRFSQIACSADSACDGMEILIDNKGCDKVMIDSIECLENNACNHAKFDFIGDIDVSRCLCGASCSSATGLSKCFQNLDKIQCSDPLSCFGQTTVVTNPANWFYFECGGVQSCQNGDFKIELTKNAKEPILYLDSFVFGGRYAGKYAKFTIDNQQGMGVTINRIECNGPESCVGMVFITGKDVFVADIHCDYGACVNCLIKERESDVGRPCDSSQVY